MDKMKRCFWAYYLLIFSIHVAWSEELTDSIDDADRGYMSEFDEAMRYAEENNFESENVDDILDEAFKNNTDNNRKEADDFTDKLVDKMKDVVSENADEYIDKAKEEVSKFVKEKIQSIKDQYGSDNNSSGGGNGQSVADLPEKYIFKELQKKHEKEFNKWSGNETAISLAEIENKRNMAKIHGYQTDMFNSLTSIDGILKLIGQFSSEAFKYVELAKLVKEIISVHDQICDEVYPKSFSELKPIYYNQSFGYDAVNAMKDLKQRSENIKKEAMNIAEIWKNGMSLQNNADRIKRLDNIEIELRSILSTSYVLLNRMRMLKIGDAVQQQGEFKVDIDRAKIAEKVLNENKYILR